MATTPAHPRTLVAAHLLVQFAVVTVATILAVVVGTLAFPMSLPGSPAWFIISFVLGAVSLRAIGLLIGAVVSTAPAGAAVQALSDSWSGSPPQASSLVIMLIYAAAAGSLAIRLFRWQ